MNVHTYIVPIEQYLSSRYSYFRLILYNFDEVFISLWIDYLSTLILLLLELLKLNSFLCSLIISKRLFSLRNKFLNISAFEYQKQKVIRGKLSKIVLKWMEMRNLINVKRKGPSWFCFVLLCLLFSLIGKLQIFNAIFKAKV